LKDRDDKGIIYESYVHNYLKKMIQKNMKLLFWRTRDNDEVDFVLLKNLDPFIFEVKSKLNSLTVPSGIKKFIRSYPNIKKAFVINETLSGIQSYEKAKIYFLPFKDLEKHKEIKLIFK